MLESNDPTTNLSNLFTSSIAVICFVCFPFMQTYYRNKLNLFSYLNFLTLIVVNFYSTIFISQYNICIILKMTNLTNISVMSIFRVNMWYRLTSFKCPNYQLIV